MITNFFQVNNGNAVLVVEFNLNLFVKLGKKETRTINRECVDFLIRVHLI